MESGWESQLDNSMLEQSRQKILQVLNTGSLKELKGLQQIGDKKAKLILGWREIHGHFTKVGVETVQLRLCYSPHNKTLSSVFLSIHLYNDLLFCSWRIWEKLRA